MFSTLAYYSLEFYKEFHEYTERRLHELGLNMGSLFFILYIGKHPGCTPSELTRSINADWGHSQRRITQLAEEGFITKEKSGKSYRLDLTEKGREAFDVSHSVFTEWDEMKLRKITAEEREALLTILAKIGFEDKRLPKK